MCVQGQRTAFGNQGQRFRGSKAPKQSGNKGQVLNGLNDKNSADLLRLCRKLHVSEPESLNCLAQTSRMGDIISLIASESEKRKRYAPCQFRNLQRFALRDVYSQQASWTRDRDKVARRRKRWALKKEIFDSRVEEFALSRPMFDPGAGTSWECTEILGKGSFGVVGLWQQFDYRGNPEDAGIPSTSELPSTNVPSLLQSRRLMITHF